MKKIGNELFLGLWLRIWDIDTSQWGTSETKTIANLWQEYRQGEITFRDNPPTRVVRVVQIILRRGDRVLYEIAQEFQDGRLRQRLQPPSEKMVKGESQFDAAERCLREELGLDPDEIQLLSPAVEVTENVTDSPSYPGLRTHYTIYSIEATAEGLPDDDFWRVNEAAAAGDPVLRHLWGWRRRS